MLLQVEGSENDVIGTRNTMKFGLFKTTIVQNFNIIKIHDLLESKEHNSAGEDNHHEE